MTRLSTGDTSDWSELLEPFSDKPVLLILVSISPRHQHTGLLEDQGDWILDFLEDGY